MSATIIDAGQEFIEHYGVLGMKWGVRRDKEDLSQKSDAELKAVVDRVRLETQYRDATTGSSARLGRQYLSRAGNTLFNATMGAIATAAVASTVGRLLRR